jgi:trk system potassium uptake protein TrkA
MNRHAVIGLGKFGMAVATELAQAGEWVLGIDADPSAAREAQAHLDEVLVGDATDRDGLLAMGVGRVDVAVIAVGHGLASACRVALHLGSAGVPEIIAKVSSEEDGEILRRVGATRVVFPERDVARRLAGRLGSPNMLDYLAIAAGVSVVELAPPARAVGRSLEQLDIGQRDGVQVLAVKELVPDRAIINPSADRVIKDSDVLIVMGPEAAIDRLRRD